MAFCLHSKILWFPFETYFMGTNLFSFSKYRECNTASVELKWIQTTILFLKDINTVLTFPNILPAVVKYL